LAILIPNKETNGCPGDHSQFLPQGWPLLEGREGYYQQDHKWTVTVNKMGASILYEEDIPWRLLMAIAGKNI